MIVSWDWLAEYVSLPASHEELAEWLMMSGLNHEGTEQVGDDFGIDLEVTSNRFDCLGHLGVAREIATLYHGQLNIPPAEPPSTGPSIKSLVEVQIESPELCPAYTARLVKGVKIGPSPQWLADRLRTLGIAVINNVVDVTNYVMFECGQPLHAFDFNYVRGGKIIVRAAKPGEKLTAIDHREYELTPEMCVIADAERPVALAGVMGGYDSEVSEKTVDVLIEAAEFAPLSVRYAARRLRLHSPSSYRFERGVDRTKIDWASRRCAELIMATAGGELADGVAGSVAEPPPRPPVTLRFAQLPRIVGIDVPAETASGILTRLGLSIEKQTADAVTVAPPSWRADLTREADLIEEVARIHGYEHIPEDARVPVAVSQPSITDRVVDRTRSLMVACGYHEAMTISAVAGEQLPHFRPWTNAEPLVAATPVLRGADHLRQSVIPSLLQARRHNEALANANAHLFELARVFLPQGEGLPNEPRMLAMVSGDGLLATKGVLESLVEQVVPAAELDTQRCELPLLDPAKSCWWHLGGQPLAVMGEVTPEGAALFDLRQSVTIAELSLDALIAHANLQRIAQPLSPYPPVERDLNIVFSEAVTWQQVEAIAREAAGDLLEALHYQETYRDAQRLGEGLKSLVFRLVLRSHEGTLTSERADAVAEQTVQALSNQLDGKLRT